MKNMKAHFKIVFLYSFCQLVRYFLLLGKVDYFAFFLSMKKYICLFSEHIKICLPLF